MSHVVSKHNKNSKMFNTHHFPEYLASTLEIRPRVSTVTASSSFPDPSVCALSALKSMFNAIMQMASDSMQTSKFE